MIIPVYTQCEVGSVPAVRPPGLPEPPSSILCQTCNGVTGTEYRRRVKRYSVCFLVTCSHDIHFPYLACAQCGSALAWNSVSECPCCRVATSGRCRFCPNCGTRK